MSASTVVEPTVTETDVPLKLVFRNGEAAIEMFAGPRPLPLITKMDPIAMGCPVGMLLAAF
jgi:hypothetical protein